MERWIGIGTRDLLIGAGAIVAIVFAVRFTKPVYANKPPVVAQIKKVAPTVAKLVVKDTTHRGRLVGTPQFQRDRRAFSDALVNTNHVERPRADSIAYYAVRESYVNAIPPAVVFGVMLTENTRFISKAQSSVGAVGLMQVYPKVWLKALSPKLGKDLGVDSTNIKYGTRILREYIKSDSGAIARAQIQRGLLKYNGCVRGTTTPNCRTYPSKVQKYVESLGSTLCPGETDFYDCIAKPFLAGLFGRSEETAVQ